MKLEKIYKFVETLDEEFKGCVTYSRQDYSDIWIESRHKTEGYFITKEQLEDIISEAYIEGHAESAYRLFREGYTEEKLKEIEG